MFRARTKNILLACLCFVPVMATLAQHGDSARLLKLQAPDSFCVEMRTSIGNMVIQVNRHWSPLAADRFYQLVTSGYFNDSRLFRSNRKYLQFGIGNDSAVNAFWDRHPIKDEPVIQKNSRGTISFAISGPNSRSASVFLNKIDNPKLDTIQGGMGFPPFGQIIQGDSLLALFENRYEDSVVFKHWDSMVNKGNAYTDSVLPGLDRVILIKVVECSSAFEKGAMKKD